MTNKTRYFVIASLLVLTVGLGTGLLAYYLGDSASALTREGGPDELQFVPSNTSLVAFANVHEIMTSPLREKLRTMLPMKLDGQREFAAQTGINIETDIDRVIAAVSSERSGDTTRPGAALVLARGRFDNVKIEALMREHGGRVEDYKGKRLIIGEVPDGKTSLSLAFLEPGLIAVGGSNMVRSSVDLASGGASVTTNEEVMNLVRDLDAGTAWAVGRFDELASQASLPAGVGDKLPAIEWFSATVRVDSGLRGVVRAVTRDEESANGLRDVVRGVMALGKLQASARPEVETLMRSLQIGGTGKTVALSFDVPSELLESLSEAVSSRPNVQK